MEFLCDSEMTGRKGGEEEGNENGGNGGGNEKREMRRKEGGQERDLLYLGVLKTAHLHFALLCKTSTTALPSS